MEIEVICGNCQAQLDTTLTMRGIEVEPCENCMEKQWDDGYNDGLAENS